MVARDADGASPGVGKARVVSPPGPHGDPAVTGTGESMRAGSDTWTSAGTGGVAAAAEGEVPGTPGCSAAWRGGPAGGGPIGST